MPSNRSPPMFRKALRKYKKKEYFYQNGQNRSQKYKINQYDAKGVSSYNAGKNLLAYGVGLGLGGGVVISTPLTETIPDPIQRAQQPSKTEKPSV